MSDLNENEQMHLDRLEADLKVLIELYGEGSKLDHFKTLKTCGSIPWKAMVAFCEAHDTPVPDWPDMVKF